MTITEAVRYNEDTDSMTDPAFVAKWADAREAVLIAQGLTRREASIQVNAELIAMEG